MIGLVFFWFLWFTPPERESYDLTDIFAFNAYCVCLCAFMSVSALSPLLMEVKVLYKQTFFIIINSLLE